MWGEEQEEDEKVTKKKKNKTTTTRRREEGGGGRRSGPTENILKKLLKLHEKHEQFISPNPTIVQGTSN